MDWRLKVRIFACLLLLRSRTMFFMFLMYFAYMEYVVSYNHPTTRSRKRRYSMILKIPDQMKHLSELTDTNDVDCVNNLRMDRNAFAKLCNMLKCVGGLREQKHMRISEQVAIFLSVLAHHKSNRNVGLDFKRSGDTISRYFNKCLDALLKCHKLLFVKPQPIGDECDNDNWKSFKGCLGALGCTLIPIKVRLFDQHLYKSRNGITHVNVLGVCDENMQFVYVLAGWEGSVANNRVFKDAITRPTGLKVPTGNYYLCDCGYMNANGFLTPYRDRRYHFKELRDDILAPQDAKEYFNMKHCKARNIINKAFQRLKDRWAILRSPAFYPVKTHNKIVICCALLHNFIRKEMKVDPMDLLSSEEFNEDDCDAQIEEDQDLFSSVEASNLWNAWRDELAQDMFNSWKGV